MYKCREASTKEIIAFQKEFCENLSAAIGMNNKGRLQVQIEQDLSSNYISGIHLIKKSVEQFIRSVVA